VPAIITHSIPAAEEPLKGKLDLRDNEREQMGRNWSIGRARKKFGDCLKKLSFFFFIGWRTRQLYESLLASKWLL